MDFIKEGRFSVLNGDAMENELSALAAKLEHEFADMALRMDAIEQDAALSAIGREQAIAALYSEKQASLDAFKQKVESNLIDRAANMAHALAGAVKLPELDTARMRWVAEHFAATADPVGRAAALQEAIAGGDYELVAAVLGAPTCLRLVADSVRLDVEQRLAAKFAPEHALTALDVKEMREMMQHNFTRAEKVLEPLRVVAMRVHPEKYDPTYRAAKGSK